VRRKREYTPKDKADALAHLAAEGGNVKRAALAAGIPRKTLEGWGKGRGIDLEVYGMIEETKKRLAAKLMTEAEEMADALPGKRAAATYQQALVGIGIAVDKAQLLTGGPTAITAEAERRRQTAEEALERLFELAKAQRPEVTKTEVRDVLIARRPDLRALLMPDPRGEGVELPA
jgi:transposase-like protein